MLYKGIKWVYYAQTVLKQQLRCSQCFHSSSHLNSCGENFQEIKIPVPWGHVAGKWWGRRDIQPVVSLHGVQDNAATFDKLTPLLDVEALLALDMPGHGMSSHFPRGIPYDFMDGVIFLRFVISEYYRFSKPVVLLSHSFGSFLSYVYSAAYPDQVSKFISIDCSRHHMSDGPGMTIPRTKKTLEKLLQYEEERKPPEYSYEELVEFFHKGRKGMLSLESCKVLLSRGMTTLDNGKVYMSRDIKLKLNAFGRLTVENMLQLAPRIKCDVLSITFDKGTVQDNPKGDIYRKTVESINKNSHKSKHVIIPGYHHCHLDDPKPVAAEINSFLSS